MKNFFSIEKFKELQVLFILEIFMAWLLTILISLNKSEINYWDWRAFVISISLWGFCSIIDKKTYWNLATLLGIVVFLYLLWWFVLNLQFN